VPLSEYLTWESNEMSSGIVSRLPDSYTDERARAENSETPFMTRYPSMRERARGMIKPRAFVEIQIAC
jgi:hypothetical protein